LVNTLTVYTQLVSSTRMPRAVLRITLTVRPAGHTIITRSVSAIGRHTPAEYTHLVQATAKTIFSTVRWHTLSIRATLSCRTIHPHTYLPDTPALHTNLVCGTILLSATSIETFTPCTTLPHRALNLDTIGVSTYPIDTHFAESRTAMVLTVYGIAVTICTHSAFGALHLSTGRSHANTIQTHFTGKTSLIGTIYGKTKPHGTGLSIGALYPYT